MFPSNDGDNMLLLTADELASLTTAEQQLLVVLTHSFSAHELSRLTADDLAFFLRLQANGLPDIPLHEALSTARAYQDRVRKRLSTLRR